MNVTVIKGKDILRYMLILVTGLMISFFIYPKITNRKESAIQKEAENTITKLKEMSLKECIEVVLPIFNTREEAEVKTSKNYSTDILVSQLGMFHYLKSNNMETEKVNTETEEKERIQMAETDLETRVVEENNIVESYNNERNTVRVKNQTNFDISGELENPQYTFTNKRDVLIFHTHTCESYTPSEQYNYEMTGTYRTTDLNYTVARVGDELTKQLTEYGLNVTHDITYHDYPAYSGSYGRSLATVQNLLKGTTNAEMVIDLHRDAVGSNNNYAPTVQIGEEYAAQLMFVMGTNGGGLEHSNWRQNMSMAVKIQTKANELYPGLFRPIILRNSRYNQHLTTGACIIEVGATGNTMEQCLTSMKYLAKVLSDVMGE